MNKEITELLTRILSEPKRFPITDALRGELVNWLLLGSNYRAPEWVDAAWNSFGTAQSVQQLVVTAVRYAGRNPDYTVNFLQLAVKAGHPHDEKQTQ